MFNYSIHTDNSPEIAKRTCEKIEKAFPKAEKKKLLIDVDGSTVQTFVHEGKEIDVYDDYEVGAVYVKSEVNLNEILK